MSETPTSRLRSPGLLWAGLLATLACCFTPILVGLFSLIGLGALTGYLDYALMPLVGFFIGALTRVSAAQTQGSGPWVIGGTGIIGFAVFFGRGTPLFAVLIVAGALLAFGAYRR